MIATPITNVAIQNNPATDVVKLLLQAHPKTAQTKNTRAVATPCSIVCKSLIVAFQGNIYIKGKKDNLPSTYLTNEIN
jgi:hypothetical protein